MKFLFMRLITMILFLIFCLQFSARGDDIKDFEIEGLSVGDSLLDYFSESEIKNGVKKNYYKSKKFLRVELWDYKPDTYDVLSFHIKNNDIKYLIYEISGNILYDEKISDCYLKQKDIINELSLLFKDSKHHDSGRQTYTAVDNESTYDRYDLIVGDASVDITCYNWSNSSGYRDHLSIGINTKEFRYWLNNEAN